MEIIEHQPVHKRWNRSVFLSVILFYSLGSPRFAPASDFWVYPGKFDELSQGETLSIEVGRGDVFPKSEERAATNKLKLWVYSPEENELPVSQEKLFWKGEFTVTEEGAHLIVAGIDEDYWTQKGMKWKNLPRNKVQMPSSSIAFWNLSKAVLSDKRDNNLYRKNLGFSLEIIALDNPARIKPGGVMRLKVFFQGRPASFLPVEATYAGFNRNPDVKAVTVRTNQEGIAKIPIEHNGLWFVSTRKFLRNINNVQYKNASYQSNLIFKITP